ncbi:winged helix-turn-helix domain-containing protein [Jiangella endophytica]|uniref:winged helix-turn-helix domain-containing protein n=1 Tax=Jiangella endophytica TaxID=1623398 RepID=UPI000E34DAB8|nr:winged helix-turn-helix domain-containing protein [Jiangella endophytica]
MVTSSSPPRPSRLPGAARTTSDGAQIRGFLLQVDLDGAGAASVQRVIEALRRTAMQLVPDADVRGTIVLAPRPAPPDGTARSLVVDVPRKRVLIDGESAGISFPEFELLQYLALREGRTIGRAELVAGLRVPTTGGGPNHRAIDVRVRRLRVKLGSFKDVVRTVRGSGYRFDGRPGVRVVADAGGSSGATRAAAG